ncbi:hypothetical protein [Clostridium cadaveris]|uniref:hypothetical protein n=1 Tax=Clostridium cadaveris TaxID=1529 RepID=UPI0015B69C9E|nr:hypothetical protein [Clostridium cadaveris]NWK10417.1 hypothetical protein [Clostridium cadaveris]
MNKDKKEVDQSKIIEKTAKVAAEKAAEEVLNRLSKRNMIKKELSYYKRVEILLYNYNNLKEAVKQKEEDINYIKVNGLPEQSGSVVVYQTSGGGVSKQDKYMQILEKYELERKETIRDIKRIDNALLKIKKDKYYKIIELKYLTNSEEGLNTDERLAEKLNKDQSTITRNRKRLMNKLTTILFPQSIKDFA